MQQNLVSIIVPVYNAGNYIEETIRMVEAPTIWNTMVTRPFSRSKSQIVRGIISKKPYAW